MQLRPYQSRLIESAAKELASVNKVIFCSPTGSGKTVMFSEIIRRHIEKSLFNRVLVLTHRTELFSQTLSAVLRTGVDVQTLEAGQRIAAQHRAAQCIVGMVETVKRRRIEDLGSFTLVIVDEAHRADFNRIVAETPAKVVGATATPISASKKHPLKDLYDSIVVGDQIPALIEQGYLARPRHMKAAFDHDLVKRGGEYTAESQYEALRTEYENLVQLWAQHARDLRTIVFCINQAHTRETCERFRAAGIRAESILSGSADRDGIMERFRAGETQVLVNCEIATTGFDVPGIECVVINRATASLPLWLQMVGRGSRVTPEKDSFLILDFGGNIDRHGMWHIDRDWKRIFHEPAEAEERPAPHKECPECGNLLLASAAQCACGHVFPREETEAERVLGYLVEVDAIGIVGRKLSTLSVSELYHLEQTGKYRAGYIARVLRSRGQTALQEYARLKGYKPGWVYYQLNQPAQFTDYTVVI